MSTTHEIAVTPEDIGILARTIYGEARGEPYEGKKAIAHVVLNRVRRGDGQFRRDVTLAAACLRWMQFSCWNPDDPNVAAITRVDPDDSAFRECQRAAHEAMDETDFTGGATHYHTVQAPRGAAWPPAWARGHRPTCTVGAHAFYAGIA